MIWCISDNNLKGVFSPKNFFLSRSPLYKVWPHNSAWFFTLISKITTKISSYMIKIWFISKILFYIKKIFWDMSPSSRYVVEGFFLYNLIKFRALYNRFKPILWKNPKNIKIIFFAIFSLLKDRQGSIAAQRPPAQRAGLEARGVLARLTARLRMLRALGGSVGRSVGRLIGLIVKFFLWFFIKWA